MELIEKDVISEIRTYTYVQKSYEFDFWELNKADIQDADHLNEKRLPKMEVSVDSKRNKLRTMVCRSPQDFAVYLTGPSCGRVKLTYS